MVFKGRKRKIFERERTYKCSESNGNGFLLDCMKVMFFLLAQT